MSKYLFIVNPISGRGAGLKAIPLIKQIFDRNDINYKIARTEYPGHAISLVSNAIDDDIEVVVSVGGDGTANEVLNGIIKIRETKGKNYTMGIIAVGRGNDFAYGLGVPTGIEEGSEIIIQDHRKYIDVGFVKGGNFPNGRYFGNGVGIGFDAVVGFEALKLTWLSGFPSYIVAVIKTISLYFNAPTIQLTYNGKSTRQAALMTSIMNGRRMGGGFYMAPSSKIDDGKFDICLAEQVSRKRILQLIPYFLKGTQYSQKEIHFYQAQEINIKAVDGKLPAHADGETLCVAGDELDIKLFNRYIQVVCTPME